MEKELETQNEILDIMLRSFEGEASSDELSRLDSYINSNGAAKGEYENLKIFWMRRNVEKASGEEQIDAAVEIFRHSVRTRRRKIFSAVAAACVVVTAGIFGFGALTSEQDVLPNLVSVSTEAGQKSTVVLADGTKIKLFGSSSVTYSENFGQKDRILNFEGNAYFDVTHNEAMPLEVNMPGGEQVKVLGTRFDIVSSAESDILEVNLLEGKVEFRTDNVTTLAPGEKITYTMTCGRTAKTTFSRELRERWIEGTLEFDNVSITELCSYLSELYGKTVTPEAYGLEGSGRITLHISNQESLEEVLGAVALITNGK